MKTLKEIKNNVAKEVTKDLKMKARLQERSTSNKAITDTLLGKT